MRPVIKTITPISDADYIAASQTPAGAGSITLNTAFTNADGHIDFGESKHLVTITSASDISNRTFTVTGFVRGFAKTETITGPNATTVAGAEYWDKITGITISGAAAGAITIGVNGKCTSAWVYQNWRSPEFELSQQVVLSSGAVLTYQVEHTLDDINDANDTINTDEHGYLVGLTATDSGNYDTPVRATRAKVTAFTSGTLDFASIIGG